MKEKPWEEDSMWIGCNRRKEKYPEIVLLHLIGAIMILLCHFFQKAHIAALGELFISGVPMFLFVSGFLAGLKSELKPGWLKKRSIRILVPYYLWIVPCMALLWIADHDFVTFKQFFFLITNLQGLNYLNWKCNFYSAVIGMGHLWFVTMIMTCSLLLPVSYRLVQLDKENRKKWIIIVAVLIVIVQPLLIKTGIQLSYLISFFLGFLISRLGMQITDKKFLTITGGMILVTGVRFLLRRYLDTSDYYDRYFALVSAAAIGIWVFFFVFWVSSKKPEWVAKIAENRTVSYLSEISFEVYIVHMWFLNGNWQISKYVPNMIISDLIVIAMTIAAAAVLHLVSRKVISAVFYPAERVVR